jgi:hypothetical protein
MNDGIQDDVKWLSAGCPIMTSNRVAPKRHLGRHVDRDDLWTGCTDRASRVFGREGATTKQLERTSSRASASDP